MRFLHRPKPENQSFAAATVGRVSDDAWDHQRHQAAAKMILYTLNDRMRVFGPMMVRVVSEVESEHGLVIVYPKHVTYGGGDPYFPTYEWQILPKRIPFDVRPDPRKLTLGLRASPGDNLSEIMVYYLLIYVDSRGGEHPLHRLPNDFRNETMIKSLMQEGIQSAQLANRIADSTVQRPQVF